MTEYNEYYEYYEDDLEDTLSITEKTVQEALEEAYRVTDAMTPENINTLYGHILLYRFVTAADIDVFMDDKMRENNKITNRARNQSNPRKADFSRAIR